MSGPLILGIDEGTTAVKAALFDRELRPVRSVRRVVGVRHIEFMFSDRQQHYNCTWEPHSKFCNFVLPPEHIWPAFESAVRTLQQERQ